jgi:mannose-6-phosphate isomerase class I
LGHCVLIQTVCCKKSLADCPELLWYSLNADDGREAELPILIKQIVAKNESLSVQVHPMKNTP